MCEKEKGPMPSLPDNPTILELKEENEVLKERIKELEELTTKDPLTELYNRRGWEEEVEKLAEEIQRDETKGYVTIFFADLNDLKEINKGGHDKGDEYILLMRKFLKQIFIRKGDIIARWGGDEFAVVSRSNEPFIEIIVDRADQLLQRGGFQHLSYCAGAVSFSRKQFLKECGITEDMDPKTKKEKIEQGLLEKINEADQYLLTAKKMAKEQAADGRKPTIVLTNETKDASQSSQPNSPSSEVQP